MLPSGAPGHLLFLTPTAYPLGGVATWLDELVPALVARGWRVTIALASGRHHDSDAYLERHPFRDVVPVESGTGSRESRVRALARCLEKVRPTIAAGINLPDLFPAIDRARRRSGLECHAVATIHALQPDLFDDLRRLRSTLDAVIATNRLSCRLVTRLGEVESDRVHYAPYGVPPGPERRPRSAMRQPLRVGFSGRFESAQKRVDDLPELARAVEAEGLDFELLLAGDGPENDRLRERLAPFEERGKVRFVGALPAADVRSRFLPELDALIVPSRWETGPIVAWEAMAAGVPVVASRYVGSRAEGALRDGENCLQFPIGDMSAAASCLVRLRDATLRDRLVAGGDRLISERYTSERSADAWSAALFEIAKSSPRKALTRPIEPPAHGRLDTLLGPGPAETLRSLLNRGTAGSGAAAEWPHTHEYRDAEDPDFWRIAEEEDAEGEGRPC